jgi:hypothetical protein
MQPCTAGDRVTGAFRSEDTQGCYEPEPPETNAPRKEDDAGRRLHEFPRETASTLERPVSAKQLIPWILFAFRCLTKLASDPVLADVEIAAIPSK